MELHRGRLLDHVHLRVKDLAKSRTFYEAVLKVIGVPVVAAETHFFADELWVDAGAQASHVHLAFQTPDRATVERFHAAGLAAGGHDNGAPGERKYHPGYYAAYLLDPDGNNIEAVHHGPVTRSAESVVFTTPG
jgi:catechol 2,3-dioxygenase-like lactoylglutathione lyase family enzyme